MEDQPVNNKKTSVIKKTKAFFGFKSSKSTATLNVEAPSGSSLLELEHGFQSKLSTEKIEVKTGEENEWILFSERSKLYVLISNDWHERGIGIVKILCHKESGKLRVVMRQENTFKVILNFSLLDNFEMKPKDQTSWIFAVFDYSNSDLKPTLGSFAIRFAQAWIAEKFKTSIDSALSKQ